MTTNSRCRVAVCLLLCLSTVVMAQSVRLGGGLRRGFARPPLFLNVSPQDATSNFGPYSPKQIRHAYGIDALSAGITGSGQKIGIVDAYGDPSVQSDLNNFCSYYAIPSTTLQILYPQGVPATGDSGWALETAFDVPWAHAIAPGATIIVSVAKSASYSDLLGAVDAAVQAGATVISMSWGGQEAPGINFYDSHFQTVGVTYVASSGDSGELAAPYELEWPASSPYVVSVGGTTLYLDSIGNRVVPLGIASSETAWSTSGGGISAVYHAVPSFQTGWQTTGWRTVPDVSYVADPNTGVGVAYGASLYEVGGTSVGAPQWAALIALVNQSRASKIAGSADIYSVAGNPSAPNINPANFFDVTSGSNGSDPDDFATTGYDLVTGLGSPVVNNLVPALGTTALADFSLSVSPASQSVSRGNTATYTVTVHPSNGFSGAVTLSITGQPSGSAVKFTPNPGTSTSTLTIKSQSSPARTYTLKIQGVSGTLTHTTTATLTVTH